ncbi:hypothetical protein ACJX0J_040811, partial [Zea mays]
SECYNMLKYIRNEHKITNISNTCFLENIILLFYNLMYLTDNKHQYPKFDIHIMVGRKKTEHFSITGYLQSKIY